MKTTKPVHFRQNFDPKATVGSRTEFGDAKPGEIVGALMRDIARFIPRSHRHKVICPIRLRDNGVSMGWLYLGGRS